jgi:hypothetical protein
MLHAIARTLTGRLRELRGDRGSVIALAITFPLVMVLVAAIAQGALLYVAREAAVTAAQQGVDTARARGGTVAAGEAAACAYAAAAARGILRSPACTGTGGIAVTITVCGDAPSFVPLIPVRACARQQGPAERFTIP